MLWSTLCRWFAGKTGTTTIAENVAALPKERYRVEKYQVAEPADVDGDCVDDITELDNLGAMNPLNPAGTVDDGDGSVVLPDSETFQALADAGADEVFRVKFTILDIDTDRPTIYFQNTRKFPAHDTFRKAIGLDGWAGLRGAMVHDPNLIAPDGSRGVYRYTIGAILFQRELYGFLEPIHTLLAANMPLVDDNLAFWMINETPENFQDDLPGYHDSRMHVLFDEDVYGETHFTVLNPGEGYGLLRSLDPDERPHPRDVVIYEVLPNELARVAGIISAVPQTPLSHVNLRAIQDSVPNAYIAGVLDDDTFSDLIDRHVHYSVTDTGYTIRAATPAEVNEHYASSRPAEAQTPERDLSVTSITPLSDIGFDDWDSFGVKAANVAVLGTLGFPEGTIPDGFAVPFYFYDEFMKHNDLYDDIREMLANPGLPVELRHQGIQAQEAAQEDQEGRDA